MPVYQPPVPLRQQTLDIASSGTSQRVDAILGHHLTPEMYGCVGDAVYLSDASINIATDAYLLTSPSATFTSADVGKKIMVALAGGGTTYSGAGTYTENRCLDTTIASYVSATQVRLTAPAVLTVSGVAFHYGTDDKAAFQTFLTALSTTKRTGVTKAGAVYLIHQTPLRVSSHTHLQLQSTLLFGKSGTGGVCICDPTFPTTSGTKTTAVHLDFAGHGKMQLSEAYSDYYANTGRKGIGLSWIDNWKLTRPRIYCGPGKNGYGIHLLHATNGEIDGGDIQVNPLQTSPGVDGVHVLGNSNNIRISNLHVLSGDDALSLTAEGTTSADGWIHNIVVTNCALETSGGKSGVKLYVDDNGGAALIEDVIVSGCLLVSHTAQVNNVYDSTTTGTAHGLYATNAQTSRTATIRKIKVVDCVIQLLDPLAGYYTSSAIYVNYCDHISVINTDITTPNCFAIQVIGSAGFKFDGGKIFHSRGPQTLVSAATISSVAWQSGATVRYNVPDAVDLSAATTSYRAMITGCANADNNVNTNVTAVSNTNGSKYIQISNQRRSSAALDEASPTGALLNIVYVNSPAIDLVDCIHPVISNFEVRDGVGSGTIRIRSSAVASDATQFTSDALIADGYIYNAPGSIILTQATKYSVVRNLKTASCAVDNLVSEGGSSYLGFGGNEYTFNTDTDSRIMRLFSLTPASDSKHRRNKGRVSDTISGTAIQTNAATTFTVAMGSTVFAGNAYSDSSVALTAGFLQLKTPPFACNTSVSLSGSTFTVTTSAAASGSQTWYYTVEQP